MIQICGANSKILVLKKISTNYIKRKWRLNDSIKMQRSID